MVEIRLLTKELVMKTTFLTSILLVFFVSSRLFAAETTGADCGCSGSGASVFALDSITTDRPKVLLVGIGGWKSCLGASADNQYISNRFLTFVNNVRRCRPDWDVSYAMYCSPGLKTAKFDGEVRVYGRLGRGKVAEQNIGSSIAQHKVTPDSKVFVIGHSHGGWMAMRATLCLGFVDGLFTLEPVSANHCDTADYLKNRTRKIFKRRQKIVPGCRRAPTDVDIHGVFAAAGGNWTNFFLAPNTKKGDIYSSPIGLANNHMIWAPAHGKYNAHHNLGLAADVWSTIESNVLSQLDMSTVVPIEAPAIVIPTQTASLSPSFPSETRTWWNKTRQKSRIGKLVEFDGSVAFVELEDGSMKKVLIDALCEEDRNFVLQFSPPATVTSTRVSKDVSST